MSIVVVGSLRGSPGATTLVVALSAVWARAGRAPLVVEADPDGGVLAARLGLGLHPSLTDLAVRARGGVRPDEVWESTQTLPGGGPVVVAHPSPEQCQATLRNGSDRLAELLASVPGHDVLVDAGRLRPGSPALPLVEAASLVLVVVRPRLEDLATAAQRLGGLNHLGNVGLVLVGDAPYSASDVAAALGVKVLAVLPVDARGAAALGGVAVAKGAARLPLMRSARTLAGDLAARLDAAGDALPAPEWV